MTPTDLDRASSRRSSTTTATVSPGAFAELELKPLPGLLLLPGVRADYFQRTHETSIAAAHHRALRHRPIA